MRHIDISALGDQVGAVRETVMLPDGGTMQRHSWSVQNLLDGLKALDTLAEKGEPVLLSGGAPTWVVGALGCHLQSSALSFQVEELPEPLPIPALPMGEPGEKGEIRFAQTTCGDCVLLEFFADDPSKPAAQGPHNYDLTKLKDVVVPVIAPEVHLFLRSHGAFPTSLAISRAYYGKCKSIFMIFGDEVAFTCAASCCPEVQVGDRCSFPPANRAAGDAGSAGNG